MVARSSFPTSRPIHCPPSIRRPTRSDRKTAKVLSLLTVGSVPVQLGMKPDGGEIFVPNFKADTLSAVNTSANEIRSETRKCAFLAHRWVCSRAVGHEARWWRDLRSQLQGRYIVRRQYVGQRD